MTCPAREVLMTAETRYSLRGNELELIVEAWNFSKYMKKLFIQASNLTFDIYDVIHLWNKYQCFCIPNFF